MEHCQELAACCETLSQGEVKDPCLQAAGYDNVAPCLNLLNAYQNAGQCKGGEPGMSGNATLACYNEADGECTRTDVPESYKDEASKSCTDGGGVASDTCPAVGLVGCCAFAGGAVQSCAYAAASGGVRSGHVRDVRRHLVD